MKLKRRINRGFTLLELMITVVVISILAAIALPSYSLYVRKGKRAEGKAALMKAVQAQERYYTANNTYADSSTFGTLFGLSSGAAVYSRDSGTTPNSDATSPYVLSIAAGATGTIATSFKVVATPQSGFTDPECAIMSITNTGLKSASGTGGLTTCW